MDKNDGLQDEQTTALPGQLPVHPRTGLRALGVLGSGRVVWPVMGGAPDDQDDDSDDSNGDDHDDRDDRDDDGSSRDDGEGQDDTDTEAGDDDRSGDGDGKGRQHERRDDPRREDLVDRAELQRVIRERQAAKRALREAQQQLAELKRSSESETERAQREAAEKAAAEVEKKYKPLVVRTTAKAALIDAGVPKDKLDRMIRLMNLDDIEVTDDGEVDGIDAQIAELQEEYPELFTQPEPPRRKPSGAKAADGADKPPAKKRISPEQQILKRLRGEK
ncbi:phage scaffolding protein [Actinomadura miaoliensis]|uniref:Scaffolding protein n=1 Tax=Actinomadura miaoliensis TaxID=430685 RepID=A0ABP7W7X0_9ACTN